MNSDLLDDMRISEPSSAQAVTSNVAGVIDVIAEEAAESERRGRITDRTVRAMRSAGMFQMTFPSRVGGLEMTLEDQVRVVSAIARVDGGSAWNVGVLNATGIYAGRLGDEGYADLYPDRDRPTSGAFHPKGVAEKVSGGYMVTGKWDWGSGSYVADHIIGGANVVANGEPVLRPSGKPAVVGLWLPREAIEHADNWHTIGVRGSGSSSYSIDKPVFVPEKWSFDREALADPTADPLNKHVTLAFFGLTGVAIGLAQAALDLAVQAVRRKSGKGAIDLVSKRAIGQVAADIDTMYSSVLDIARRSDDILFGTTRTLTPLEEMRLTICNVTAGETLRRTIDTCVDLYGSAFVFDGDPMQRVLRDSTVALTHAGAKRNQWTTLAELALADPVGLTLADSEVFAGGH
ncbi:acyl-CoA dehydrogenase family protein (plasmid) [Rhodococcus qingshengii]|nr:acyl-CoA dehydrogenase family protein [Rhodococcus sp. YH3-3]BDQ24148.1 acyl-CoA dehydrogenase family protein [Rhodococcus qingshengii]